MDDFLFALLNPDDSVIAAGRLAISITFASMVAFTFGISAVLKFKDRGFDRRAASAFMLSSGIFCVAVGVLAFAVPRWLYIYAQENQFLWLHISLVDMRGIINILGLIPTIGYALHLYPTFSSILGGTKVFVVACVLLSLLVWFANIFFFTI
jgi:hypothetical protein